SIHHVIDELTTCILGWSVAITPDNTHVVVGAPAMRPAMKVRVLKNNVGVRVVAEVLAIAPAALPRDPKTGEFKVIKGDVIVCRVHESTIREVGAFAVKNWAMPGGAAVPGLVYSNVDGITIGATPIPVPPPPAAGNSPRVAAA